MYKIINADICKIKADAIVNASNGIGYMGGWIGKNIKLKGIAESINYATKGKVEKEAKKICRHKKYLPRYLCGYKPGEVFITGAANLYAENIIHAVTMRFPGMHSNIKIIQQLLPKIISEAHKINAKSIAIPLLGTGTGGISKTKVIALYKKFFLTDYHLDIFICIF
jgi:O-acetyl-ADP-ribose deacetylase (regulator of RNase III)